jgi:parallel beta-helix repeat protein
MASFSMNQLARIFWRAGVVVTVLAAALGVGVSSRPAQAAPLGQLNCPNLVIKSSTINSNETWTTGNIYYVTSSIVVTSAFTLTIQPGTMIKMNDDVTLDVQGTFLSQGSSGNEVIFTSVHDDSDGCDIDGDGNNILPQRGDWGAVKIHNNNGGVSVTGLIARYANEGVAAWQDLTTTVSPTITGNTFAYNKSGLAIVINNTGASDAQVSQNAFSDNEYGFVVHRDTTDTGTAHPVLQNNSFSANTILPVYLAHSAYPTYSGNTFAGYPAADQRLGIGLGNYFTSSGSLPILNSAADGSGLNMPYVVQHVNWFINDDVAVTLEAGTVIKVEYRSDTTSGKRNTPYRSITVNGLLVNPGFPADKVIFTSVRDDSVAGDTNGDGVATEPLPDDWEKVYFPEDQITLSNMEFRYANTAVYFEDTSLGGYVTRNQVIDRCTFLRNTIGIYMKAGDSASSRVNATLTNNTFSHNALFPILWMNTAFGTYSGNTFDQNDRPGIAVTGNIYTNGTWPAVVGQGLPNLPYIIYGTSTIKGPTSSPAVNPAAEVTVPADLVFKFYDTAPTDANTDPKLYVDGNIILQSSQGHPIVFTSYKDDTWRGDTNFDGTASAPARGDWESLRLRGANTVFHDAIVNYSDYGVIVENTTTNLLNPEISNNVFEHNTTGLYLIFRSTGAITSTVAHNTFNDNFFGLRTYAEYVATGNKARGIASPTLDSNSFTNHDGFPLYYNGATMPVYLNNYFANNTHPAIAIAGYWGADATLLQVSGDSTAPLLGDYFPYVVPDLDTSSGVDENVLVESGEVLTIPAATVIKLANDTYFNVYGKLDLQSNAANRIYFTSYWDDTLKGDTNGDGNTRTPKAIDWRTIYLRSDDGTTSFHDTVVRYSEFGLRIWQETTANLAPLIANNIFQSNLAGLTLTFKSDWDITSVITQNYFDGNTYGLVTNADLTALRFGSANVTLRNNTFTTNTGFPIYLHHSADITYDTNTFIANTHPAIALNGYWPRNVTWSRVLGDDGQPLTYVVFKDTRIQAAWSNNHLVQGAYYMGTGFSPPEITIPAGTVVKFDTNLGIYAWGKLNLLSTPGDPIYFTSYKDDTVGGDTNADGSATTPGPIDWKSVWLCDYPSKPNDIHDVVGRYAVAPIAVYYDGPTATTISPTIRRSTFEKSLSGILLAIGYYDRSTSDGIVEGPGEGHIYANLTDVILQDDDYGLLTYAHPKSTGIARPTLTRVSFTNIDVYPIFLGGTTQLLFVDAQMVGGPASLTPPEPLEAPIEMGVDERPDLPAQAYIMPEDSKLPEAMAAQPAAPGLQAINFGQFAPAVALGGSWNNNVTLPVLPGIPFAVAGNYPVTIVINGASHTPSDDLVIGQTNPSGSTVTLSQPGSIVKFNNNCPDNTNKKCKLVVWGNLVLQGTENDPIIFTSIHDDGAGGDTNGNGSATAPAKGQWDYIQLSGPAIDFKYALVRYAVEGVRVFFKGSDAQNINPIIQHNSFFSNNTAIVLWVAGAGDIGKRPDPGVDPDGTRMQIFHNFFMNNDKHIYVHRNESDTGSSPKPLVTGVVYADVSQNDLLATTSYGIDNDLEIPAGHLHPEYYTILAENNYWSSLSGPHHTLLNPAGTGVEVSDLVDFDPFATTPFHQSASLTVQGRITLSDPPDPNNPGVAGVTLQLTGTQSQTVTTNAQGYYQITGLLMGVYQLYAEKPGYYFTPALYGPFDLQTDAELNFTATQISPDGKYVYFEDAVVEVVQKVTGDITVSLKVLLTKPSSYSTTYKFSTVSATATSTGCPSNRTTCDYITRTNVTDTFSPGIVTRTISFTIKPGDGTEAIEYFLVRIDPVVTNPDGYSVMPGGGEVVIVIQPKWPNVVLIPLLRR